jgi:hypothetical protein
LVIVELDGPIGHFGFDFRGEENHDHARRDLQKETWALSQQISVVRVLQEDVWKDYNDWKRYLQKNIADAEIIVRVYHPPTIEYTGGIYAALRSPSSVASQ